MTWIRTIEYAASEGPLRKLYDRIKGPDDHVDNIMLAHSLRPHTLRGHMELYKNVLHHGRNRLPKWFMEALGVHVSRLNGCRYCEDHHYEGLRRQLGDGAHAAAIRIAFDCNRPESMFDPRQCAALVYATRLTEKPAEMEPADVEALREAGWDDGEILEINQVVAYFNYANRTVEGLGVDTDGDILGLSPDGAGWQHR
jgi:uncharacterized peroxidase-related enzyme